MTVAQLEANPDFILIGRRVRRIGVTRLWHNPSTGEWFVSLDNRTYHNTHGPLNPEQLAYWQKDLAPPPFTRAASARRA